MENRISFYRKQAGFTQSDLGVACGWDSPQSRVANYECFRRSPSVADVKKIMCVLSSAGVECSFEDLFPSSGLGSSEKAA